MYVRCQLQACFSKSRHRIGGSAIPMFFCYARPTNLRIVSVFFLFCHYIAFTNSFCELLLLNYNLFLTKTINYIFCKSIFYFCHKQIFSIYFYIIV